MFKVFALIVLMSAVFAASTTAFATTPGCQKGDAAPFMNGVTEAMIAHSIEGDSAPRRIATRRLLNVGAKIDPHQHLQAVTATLVKALPQYVGFGYFLSKSHIVIVHRPTRRIAYILPFCH